MANRRGNPDWGRSQNFGAVPPIVTEFERVTRELGLKETEFSNSPQLKQWVKRHRNTRYVPEHLLKYWGMEVDTSFGSLVAGN